MHVQNVPSEDLLCLVQIFDISTGTSCQPSGPVL